MHALKEAKSWLTRRNTRHTHQEVAARVGFQLLVVVVVREDEELHVICQHKQGMETPELREQTRKPFKRWQSEAAVSCPSHRRVLRKGKGGGQKKGKRKTGRQNEEEEEKKTNRWKRHFANAGNLAVHRQVRHWLQAILIVLHRSTCQKKREQGQRGTRSPKGPVMQQHCQ